VAIVLFEMHPKTHFFSVLGHFS